MKPTLQDHRRLLYIALFMLTLFSLLIIQFYRIQVVQEEKWTNAAKRQHEQVVIEPFKRGVFYSNTSIKQGHPEPPRPLVIDIPKFHLYADPDAIPVLFKEEVAKVVSTLLSLKKEEGIKLQNQLRKKSRSRKLVLWLSQENKEKLTRWWSSYAKRKKIARNALFFVQDYKRSYPYGKLMGQVLHTLREDKDVVTRQSIPTGGLELSLHAFLKGKEGKRVIQRSPRHALDNGVVITEPEDGADVYLTINHTLQAIVEEEIEKAVKNSNSQKGWGVLMDPYTGEILALAQYPWFELTSYPTYFNDPKRREDTQVKAVTDPFEPGSTMKAITITVALKANLELQKRGQSPLFSPQEKIATSTAYFPGRGGKPLKDIHPHAYMNMYMGLQKSSNVYMAKLVQRIIERLGEGWYRAALQEIFGFGTKTGIELAAESSGQLPLPGKKHPNGALEWSKGTPYSMAMGHNVLATTLQMLRCYAVLANGGYLVEPTLVRKIVKGEEVLVDHTTPERLSKRKRVLEPEIIQEVVKAMRFVTKPGGTAKKADIPGYTEAAKTGTSEKIVNGVYSKKNHISNFVGFAPVSHPRFVLAIVMDEPEYKYIPGVGRNQLGGNCCGPAFREIGLRVLQYLGVSADAEEQTDWQGEVKQLKELFQTWNH